MDSNAVASAPVCPPPPTSARSIFSKVPGGICAIIASSSASSRSSLSTPPLPMPANMLAML
eukprot:CAMPEP_0181381154 /NCGR_PEP_ID=MMETSP1106-20121128/19964_1 /TAXON_ID=81844 /ORGANISM="Mantoniella antarctica, Strain SL-175" /LENGTH=60 /DNA_ID=CAMNT_0023500307 /DNA_START=69 /DNA_END=247 /DNA_ORIENTATION=-